SQGVTLQNNKVDKSDIENSLNSSSTTKVLSAAQGKALNDTKLSKSAVDNNTSLGNNTSSPPSQNAVKVYVDNVVRNVLPTGSIVWLGSSNIPAGFLKCNGAILSTSTYSSLFSAIGYTFGGSGDSFNVPDIRGRFIRGLDDGANRDVGRTLGSIQSDSNKQHNHGGKTGVQDTSHTHSGTTNSGGAHSHQMKIVDNSTSGPVDNGGGWQFKTRETSTSGEHTHTFSTGNQSA